jgi:hypothetical protein
MGGWVDRKVGGQEGGQFRWVGGLVFGGVCGRVVWMCG